MNFTYDLNQIGFAQLRLESQLESVVVIVSTYANTVLAVAT